MKCPDCKGMGEIEYMSTRKSGPTTHPEMCNRCEGTGRGTLTADEMKAVGFRLVDTEKSLALWSEGTLVRHPVSCALARVEAYFFHGDCRLRSLDGMKSWDVSGEAHNRNDWQTVDPLFGSDTTGAARELQELKRELEEIEHKAEHLRRRIDEVCKRLQK